MTNEELLGMFPECEKIKREDIKECVTTTLTEERYYRNASNKIWRRVRELYPPYKGRYDENDPEQNAYRDYFWGDCGGGASDFVLWMKKVEEEFVARHGQLRSFDDACRLAADKWADMIFGFHVQDNGDNSNWVGMALGTIVKDDARKNYDEDVADKFRSLMTDYYKSGCKYKDCRFPVIPYCDYHPNSPLAKTLEAAGCSEHDVDMMCPWKTGVEVDPKDNSVIVRGYQSETIY